MTGCDLNGAPHADHAKSEARAIVDERFHEKSFSWSDPSATPGLAKIIARATRFETAEALGEALRALDDSLRRPAFADGLWKPVDHACDGLALALWNVYGAVSLEDSVVLDESMLRARCADIGDDAPRETHAAPGKHASHPAREADHRVYPYKMIGRSWDNFDLVVYKSTGAETQFKKHRTKAFTTAWWDTDAARLDVRAYFLNCGMSGATRICYYSGLRSAAAQGTDYVAQRDFSAGIAISSTDPQSASSVRLKVSDAVIGLHAADHAGIAFRATSSSGLTAATVLVGVPTPKHVTW